LADCDKSLGLNPRDKGALETRGHAYFKLGQYQRAIQDYDAALGRDEHLSQALYARGIAKLKLGDTKGESDMAAAKAINPYIAEDSAELGIMP
jgi:tetratricopeptide (TPR) repeat protein